MIPIIKKEKSQTKLHLDPGVPRDIFQLYVLIRDSMMNLKMIILSKGDILHNLLIVKHNVMYSI